MNTGRVKLELPKIADTGYSVPVTVRVDSRGAHPDPAPDGDRLPPRRKRQRVARNALHSFACRYNGVEVFRATLGTGIAANPVLRFFFRAESSGELEFRWLDDEDVEGGAKAQLVVMS